MNEIIYLLLGLCSGVLLAGFLHRRFGIFDAVTDEECGVLRGRVPDDYPEGRIPGPRGPLGID